MGWRADGERIEAFLEKSLRERKRKDFMQNGLYPLAIRSPLCLSGSKLRPGDATPAPI
jgi:hypothetical protein